MNTLLKKEILPDGGLLIACSSHEPRCRGALELGAWKPEKAVVFHYDDPNPKRDVNHAEMLNMLDTAGVEHHTVEFTEVDAVQGLRENMVILRRDGFIILTSANCFRHVRVHQASPTDDASVA